MSVSVNDCVRSKYGRREAETSSRPVLWSNDEEYESLGYNVFVAKGPLVVWAWAAQREVNLGTAWIPSFAEREYLEDCKTSYPHELKTVSAQRHRVIRYRREGKVLRESLRCRGIPTALLSFDRYPAKLTLYKSKQAGCWTTAYYRRSKPETLQLFDN